MLKQLAVFYLFFSLVLFTSAVPSSRSLISSEEDISVPRLVGQEVTAGENHAGGALIEGRLDFELEDYPPTGASGRHDPQVPGPPPPAA